MLRFHCPDCGKKVKATESLAGKNVACPGCGEAVPVPEPRVEEDSPGLFPPMGTRPRLAVGSVAMVGVLGTLSATVLPCMVESAWATTCGLIATGLSLLALLAILHGHGTGCPSCGAWWTRQQVGTEVGEREEFERDGVTYKRSTAKTQFMCEGCSHTWSVSSSEEYPVSESVAKFRRG